MTPTAVHTPGTYQDGQGAAAAAAVAHPARLGCAAEGAAQHSEPLTAGRTPSVQKACYGPMGLGAVARNRSMPCLAARFDEPAGDPPLYSVQRCVISWLIKDTSKAKELASCCLSTLPEVADAYNTTACHLIATTSERHIADKTLSK